MGLPYVIEYLVSMRRPDGGHLVNQGIGQIIVPSFPPFSTLNLTNTPWGNEYAYIAFRSQLGAAVLPGCFINEIQQHGNRAYSGTMGSWFTNNSVDGFDIITDAEPSIIRITSISPLNQYWEGVTLFVGINSEDDFHLVLEAIKRVATSVKSEQLQAEANSLLAVIAGTPASPNPPII